MASACFEESLVRQVSWFLSPHNKGAPKGQTHGQGQGQGQGTAEVQKGHESSFPSLSLSLSGPSAAQSLLTLSSDFNRSRGGDSAYGDDCTDTNSVISSSNMHEGLTSRHLSAPTFAQRGSSQSPLSDSAHVTSANNNNSNSNNSNSSNATNCNSSGCTDSGHSPHSSHTDTPLSSHSELAVLETDPICPYRLVTTFQVRYMTIGIPVSMYGYA